MRVVEAFMTFNVSCCNIEKVLAQVVESTLLCKRTWVWVLCMPIVCYFNLCITVLIYLNASHDNIILKL